VNDVVITDAEAGSGPDAQPSRIEVLERELQFTRTRLRETEARAAALSRRCECLEERSRIAWRVASVGRRAPSVDAPIAAAEPATVYLDRRARETQAG
jgi:hypothetical protein